MEAVLEKTPEGITIGYEDKIVRLHTNEALKSFLDLPGNGASELADRILARYAELMGKPLMVSQSSLAVEILVHVYVDVFAQKEQELARLLPDGLNMRAAGLGERLHAHTVIIDIGEKSVDTNRWVFDALAPYSGALYAVLGRHA